MSRFGFIIFGGLLSFLVSMPAAATEQIRDDVELDGITSPLDASPLYSRIGLTQDVLKLDAGSGRCSANWRGYKAHWRVAEERLTLVRVETDVCSAKPIPVNLAPLAKDKDFPVASWYTGVLIVPRGQPTAKPLFGSPQSPGFVVLVVKRGHILSRTDVDEPLR